MRTVADRPLGVLLSGGIDSTLIASRLATQGYQQFSTFTAAFPGSTLDESIDAADSAQRMGLSNIRIDMPDNLAADFSHCGRSGPAFCRPIQLPHLVSGARSQQARESGAGGRWRRRAAGRLQAHEQASAHPLAATPATAAGHPSLAGWQAGQAGHRAGDGLAIGLFAALFRHDTRPAPLSASRAQLQQLSYWRAPDDIGPEASDAVPGLQSLLAIDFANYLPDYILQKSDLCTMAHGLESRAPLLDHGLYQHLLATTDAERYTQPAKLIFRRAMHPALPADFFQRKKRGFNPPLSGWLKTSLAERFSGLGSRLNRLTDGLLDATAVDAFAKAYRGGKEALAEQMLQLLILDESLTQLDALRRALP
jgi:asparagine synthase (glutamine-hydrolysing)